VFPGDEFQLLLCNLHSAYAERQSYLERDNVLKSAGKNHLYCIFHCSLSTAVAVIESIKSFEGEYMFQNIWLKLVKLEFKMFVWSHSSNGCSRSQSSWCSFHWKAPTLSGPLERTNLNHWILKSMYVVETESVSVRVKERKEIICCGSLETSAALDRVFGFISS
jgi:hypothetical protein